MAAKIVAVSHGLIAAILACFATTIPRSQAPLVYGAMLACGVVAYGCWVRHRWLAGLGAALLSAAAIAAVMITSRLPGFFNPGEKTAIGVVAFSAIALEVVTVVLAGEPPEPTDSSSK
ncbi:MAG TPA: hypothetical protein VMJ35_08705 [Dongiaceae bacterium]|nr:hypothetical protein [Dongiaceae bacterium]